MKNPEILSICPSQWSGMRRSLVNLQLNCGLTRHVDIPVSDPGGRSLRFVNGLAKEFHVKWVILGSWLPQYEGLCRQLKKDRIRIAVYWSSSLGQMDLAGEVKVFIKILNNRQIDFLLSTNQQLVQCLKGARPAFYVPDTLVDLEEANGLPESVGVAKRYPCLNLSLFLPPTEAARKNVSTLLVAVSGLHRPYCLYLNGLSKIHYYRAILQKFKIRFKDFGWLPEEKYQQILGQIDLGLQVSFAETFDHIAAEHLMRGIPVLVSPMVPCLEMIPGKWRKDLIVNEIGDSQKILARIEWLADRVQKSKDMPEQLKQNMKTANKKRIGQAKRSLFRLLRSPGSQT